LDDVYVCKRWCFAFVLLEAKLFCQKVKDLSGCEEECEEILQMSFRHDTYLRSETPTLDITLSYVIIFCKQHHDTILSRDQ
jgi:hypothetical protein